MQIYDVIHLPPNMRNAQTLNRAEKSFSALSQYYYKRYKRLIISFEILEIQNKGSKVVIAFKSQFLLQPVLLDFHGVGRDTNNGSYLLGGKIGP